MRGGFRQEGCVGDPLKNIVDTGILSQQGRDEKVYGKKRNMHSGGANREQTPRDALNTRLTACSLKNGGGGLKESTSMWKGGVTRS